jgi:hypothetical protein
MNLWNRNPTDLKGNPTDLKGNPTDLKGNPTDLKINHQVVFDYIRYAFYYYTPSKPNKKKMKQLIESIPYFLPDEKQNTFYEWIRKYPIETYWDTHETMQEYGYLLYSSPLQSLSHPHKSKKEYMEDLFSPPNTYQQKHSIVFFLVLGLLFYFLSRIK